MIKQDLIHRVAERIDQSRAIAETSIEGVLDSLRQAMQRGERIELRGFGVFTVRPRKTGIGRNPRTKKIAPIPPGRVVRFKPSKFIKALHSESAK